MSRRAALPVLLGLLHMLLGAGCTLILDTEALITPCTVDQECDDALGEGYQCEENACLPVDVVDDGSEGEGEGE